MAKAVKIGIYAKQSVKGPAREAASALEKLGNRAAKAGEQLLSIERARAGFELLKKGVELTAKAFASMAKNSKSMAGELAAVEKATNRAWAAMGDMVAESRSFQAVVDAITEMPLDAWIRDNAAAMDGAMAVALQAGIVGAKGLTLALGGIIETSITAARVVPAAWEDAVRGVELAAHTVSFVALQLRDAVTFGDEASKQLRAEIEATRLAAQRAAAAPSALAEAIEQAGREVLAVDEFVEATLAGLDKLDTRLADRSQRRGTAAAPGDPKAAAAAAKAEAARQASIAKAFEEVSEAQIALQEYQAGAEQMALDQLQAALDHQAQVWEGARRQMKAAADFEQKLLDDRAANWGAFSGAVDASMGAVISGMEAFGASQEAMAVASAAATALTAGVKAGYEVAEALAAAGRYDFWGAVQHGAAAAQYAMVAASGVASVTAGSSGGGGGGGAPPAPVEPEPIRAAERSTGGEQITYVQEVHYHGAVIQERQAARDINDLMGGSNRSGVSRFRGGR